MVICGRYMFEFSVSLDMEEKNINDKRRILSYLLGYRLTLIVKKIEN